MFIRSMLFALVFAMMLGCAVMYWGNPAHAAELRYQCADYAPYPHVVWHDCGAAVKIGAPAASDHQPPRFLPAVVLYDKDNRFIAMEVGKKFSYTCKAALDDAQATIEKATAAGRRLVGLCIPVPTYSAADLVPAADPPKSSTDNSL